MRRADGQVIQRPELLYVIAEHIDGQRGYDEIATLVTEAFKRGVSGENVQMLVEEKLFPLGVVGGVDGAEADLQPAATVAQGPG